MLNAVWIIALLASLASLVACSEKSKDKSDSTEETSENPDGDPVEGENPVDEQPAEECTDCIGQDMTGSIASLSGGQSALQGWYVIMVERDSNLARVGEVDAAGQYRLRQVDAKAVQTLLLLSPDFLVQAVLSLPSEAPGTIRQFFQMAGDSLPKLTSQGSVMKFADVSAINITGDLSSDQDGDGVPDGSVSIGLLAPDVRADDIDTDLDGIPNISDADLDGDGIINVIDPDDDGDTILDIFDPDADASLKNDVDEAQGDHYFSLGLEHVVVQWIKTPKESGDGLDVAVLLSTKARELETPPKAIQIRGHPSLFEGAKRVTVDDAGKTVEVDWNLELLDDGKNNDGNAGDKTYSAYIKLKNERVPRASEMIFFQMRFGPDSDPWFWEFPTTFPPIVPGDMAAQFEPNSQTVLKISEAGKRPPFGDIIDYLWSTIVYDQEGKVVHVSDLIPGTENAYALPTNILQSGKKYSFEVVAQDLRKVTGLPEYLIHSEKYPITVP